ncbi:hypothetical protein Vretifemale_8409, partial [Volvox reticuliferus]
PAEAAGEGLVAAVAVASVAVPEVTMDVDAAAKLPVDSGPDAELIVLPADKPAGDTTTPITGSPAELPAAGATPSEVVPTDADMVDNAMAARVGKIHTGEGTEVAIASGTKDTTVSEGAEEVKAAETETETETAATEAAMVEAAVVVAAAEAAATEADSVSVADEETPPAAASGPRTVEETASLSAVGGSETAAAENTASASASQENKVMEDVAASEDAQAAEMFDEVLAVAKMDEAAVEAVTADEAEVAGVVNVAPVVSAAPEMAEEAEGCLVKVETAIQGPGLASESASNELDAQSGAVEHVGGQNDVEP